MPLSIPLKIDFGDAVPSQPYPVCGGVPFARGLIRSIDRLRLIGNKEERECQIAQTAVWPDGSVKWALLDFFAVPGESFQLEAGDGVKRQPIRHPVSVTEQHEEIRVDTGMLRLCIRKDGTGFIDEGMLDDRVVVDKSAERRHIIDYIRVNKTDARPTNTVAITGSPDASCVEIETLEVEASGPLHAVILMRGYCRYHAVGATIEGIKQSGACPFTVRLHAWRGSGMMAVEHFFAYEGDPDVDFIRCIGLGFSTPLIRDAQSVTWGDDKNDYRSQTIDVAFGIHQASADHYEIWRSGNPYETMHNAEYGRRAVGWMDVSGGDAGLAFGVRHFWRQYEKSLHADTGTGRIDAWLWPPEAQTLDYRRYARAWNVGEDGAYDDNPMPCNYRLAAKGAGKSHDLLFYFHHGNAQEADVARVFAAFDARPLVLAPPEYYAGTRALGFYHAREDGRFDDLEQVIQRPVDYLKYNQARFRWYGFFDYGDVQTCFATFHRHDRWESDFGRWGWANGDQVGRLNYALMLQFIRTGDRANFEFAEANMRHVHDVDTTHAHEYPFKMGDEFRDLAGSVHRHNAQHWACPYVGSRGAHPVGAKIHYYLTGAGRSKDIIDDVLALAERIPGGAARDGHGTSALSYLCAWERAGDTQYRDKTLAILQDYGLEDIKGGWMAMISAAFGVFDAMVEYTDLSGDRRFVSTIIHFAGMCMGPDIENNWTYPGGYFRIYAEALRFSKDDRYLEGIGRARRRLVEQMQASASFLPSEQWPAPRGGAGGAFSSFSIDANTLRDLPFLMEAMGKARGKGEGGREEERVEGWKD